MRTVSFASAPVNEMLNNDFVCHVINTEGDPAAGSSQAHAPSDPGGRCSEGLGNQNVQALFLTPEGNIFHTASGFCGPRKFRQELQFAQELFEEIRQAPEKAEEIVMTSHRKRMVAEGISEDSFNSEPERRTTASDLLRSRAGDAMRRSGRTSSVPSAFEMLSKFGNVFSDKQKRTKELDYQFALRCPMMPLEELEQNPRLLVGRGVTSFASGNASGGRIGGSSRPNQSSR